MHSTKSSKKLRRPALLATLMTLAVCLTACSDLWEVSKAELPKDVAVLQNDARTPDIPAHLVKCINTAPKPGKTADEVVTNLKLTADERKACAAAILAWYKELQKANKKASTKPPPTS